MNFSLLFFKLKKFFKLFFKHRISPMEYKVKTKIYVLYLRRGYYMLFDKVKSYSYYKHPYSVQSIIYLELCIFPFS